MDAVLAPYVYAVLAAAGAAAGFIDAIAGGGGLISFPALMWAGLPIPVALGTNKLQSSCGTTLAVIRFTRAGLIPWRTLRLAVIVYGLTAAVVQKRVACHCTWHYAAWGTTAACMSARSSRMRQKCIPSNAIGPFRDCCG